MTKEQKSVLSSSNIRDIVGPGLADHYSPSQLLSFWVRNENLDPDLFHLLTLFNTVQDNDKPYRL